ncbi:MAG: rod shape-determining protein MreD [Eubacteriales bacterium]
MSTLILSLILVMELIIQATVFQFLNFHSYYPDLLLITIVCLSIVYKKEYTYKLGLIAGLLLDILYGGIIGFYAVSLLLTSLFVNAISKNLYMESLFTPVVIFPMGAVVFHSINYLLWYLLKRSIPFNVYIMQFGLLYWVINFLFVLLMYPFILKFVRIHLFKSQIRS